jgi:hypothetical protein
MGFLRRRGPTTVLVPPTIIPPAPEPETEPCAVCGEEIQVHSRFGTGRIVAMLVDIPGEKPYALAHRSCLEREQGLRVW